VRRVLPLLVALAALLGACGDDATDDRPERAATLVLDFTPNAAHAGIYSAVERGFDDAEGVRLRVRAPSASTDAVKLLLGGRAAFAVMDIHDLALAAAKGRDLVAVMSVVQRPLAAVLTIGEIEDPRELEGRRVGVTGLPSDDAVLDSIVAGAGGDPERVERVTIGFNAVAALLGGRVAGATAFWSVEGVALRGARPDARELRVEDFGAPPYPELVLVTSRARLREDPSIVHATVRALVRGYGLTSHDPASSISDLQARVRGIDRAQLDAQLDALGPAIAPAGGRIGALDPDVLDAWADWEVRFGIVERRPDVERLFDTTVVPRSGAASEDAA
jgi:putative hydroxymethylpyrimidine transport system substrate-binding protein